MRTIIFAEHYIRSETLFSVFCKLTRI